MVAKLTIPRCLGLVSPIAALGPPLEWAKVLQALRSLLSWEALCVLEALGENGWWNEMGWRRCLLEPKGRRQLLSPW